MAIARNKTSLGLLGTGTCRLSATRATSSAYVKRGDHLLLIDCGAGVTMRLAQQNLLQGCRELDIHISHRHVDHFLGIFSLLQGLTWSDDAVHLGIETVRIHCTREVEALFNTVYSAIGDMELDLQGLNPKHKRSLQICPGPDFSDWSYEAGGLLVNSVHLPAVNNHGVRFSLEGKEFAFTCDATEVGSELLQFLEGVDVGVFDLGHLSNRLDDGKWVFDLGPVEKLLANCNIKRLVATHAYLRDLQQQILTEEARERILNERLQEMLRRVIKRNPNTTFELGLDGLVLHDCRS